MDTSGLTLLGRRGCGLCEELARDLRGLGARFTTVDIDAHEDLMRRFDEAVPVLMLDGAEIARAPFTPASLRQALSGAGIATPSRR